MRLTTLGDLLLDVIVRLDDPLVPGDDRMAETRAVAGGQAESGFSASASALCGPGSLLLRSAACGNMGTSVALAASAAGAY